MAIKVAGQEVISDERKITGAIGLDLTPLEATIADTAVDVFVYDTRKDSDGGAWRKRTQHTSWYNETLNTATRGARKEFPAVAVIVAEAAKVTIYDGDDPDLPMWMVFNCNALNTFSHTSSPEALGMLNGVLTYGTSTRVVVVPFVSENATLRNGTAHYRFLATIAERNVVPSATPVISGSPAIVNSNVNDIAMTVLPNAPIDSATGLPIPTIAVATDGGTSVIHNDGTVNDFNRVGTSYTNSVIFTDYGMGVSWGHATTRMRHFVHYDWDQLYSDRTDYDTNYYALTGFGAGAGEDEGVNNNTIIETRPKGASLASQEVGLKVATFDEANPANGLVAQIESTYNTGWMNGDIKLATLSDTDATNVTGTELFTQATFNSTGRTTSYSTDFANGTVTLDDDEGTADGFVNVILNGLTIGETYTVVIQGNQTYTPSSLPAYSNFVANASVYHYVPSNLQGTTTPMSITFTCNETTPELILYSNYAGGDLTYTVSVRLAESDRSVNNNGLQVFGTVSKTPVATGADLVSYKSTSNTYVLKQPYNSDLDFGTGDCSLQFWYKTGTPSSGVVQFICTNGETGSNNFRFFVETNDFNLRFGSLSTSTAYTYTGWTHVVLKRQGGALSLYFNGSLVNTWSESSSITMPNGLWLLGDGSSYNTAQSEVALWRISATAPAAEQIKKIYEDEKVLFQEGAQATLTGTSDAVTALAYDSDTDLLHVGSSGGRSVFSGLRRVDETATAVTTAISASNELIVEQ